MVISWKQHNFKQFRAERDSIWHAPCWLCPFVLFAGIVWPRGYPSCSPGLTRWPQPWIERNTACSIIPMLPNSFLGIFARLIYDTIEESTQYKLCLSLLHSSCINAIWGFIEHIGRGTVPKRLWNVFLVRNQTEEWQPQWAHWQHSFTAPFRDSLWCDIFFTKSAFVSQHWVQSLTTVPQMLLEFLIYAHD